MHRHFADAPAPAAAAAAPPAPPVDPVAGLPVLNDDSVLDVDWILLSGFIIILIQLGFAFVHVGSVRYRNAQSVVIKLILGIVLTVIIYWIFGYAFSFGYDEGYKFLGGNKLAAVRWEANNSFNDYSNYVLRVGGALIAAAILAEGAAERMTFIAWSILVTAYSGFIHPALVHWIFAQGWIATLGFKDFAGAGVINYAAALAALITTIIIKPRQQRFDLNANVNFTPHSPVYVAFGALVIFPAWLFFVVGSVAAGENAPYVQGITALNTLIAGATGGLFSFIIRYFRDEQTSLVALSKGVIAGLVAVSAQANDIEGWTAFIYGLFAAIIYNVLAAAIPKYHVDDPIEVVAVHLGPGFLGIFLTGLFDKKAGLFYSKGISLLGFQLLGLLIITAWVSFFVLLILLGLKGFGILRVSGDHEARGIDKVQCLGEAIVFAEQQGSPLEVKVVQNQVSPQRSAGIFDPARSNFR
ncbi:hypothetical protein pb186bvf_010062 [Paramecium bursaria]